MTDRTPARVLVVDDDRDINRLIQQRLRLRGYQTEVAYSGEEALAKVEAFAPDLVMLDVSLPGLDGLAVLDRIRTRGQDQAVIMTTAFGSEQMAIEALRRGADDYLRKPFESSEFRAVVERTLTRLILSRHNAELQRQLAEKHRQLAAELARAAAVQTSLLPGTGIQIDGFELAARCLPAREVEGDFYDWHFLTPGRLTLTLGDVMGKGMAAALLMATVRAALRAVSEQASPAAALDRVGRALAVDFDASGSFLTLFHAQLDPASGLLRFVDAGHGYGFIQRADGAIAELSVRGLPLGVQPEVTYEEGVLEMTPGDTLVLYSDGLIDSAEEGFDPRRSVGDPGHDAEATLEAILAAARAPLPPPDDLTLVVLRRLPE